MNSILQSPSTDGIATWGGRLRDFATAATTDAQPIITVPHDQRYYWTRDWQKFEAEADREIAIGGLAEFDSVRDLARDLLSDGE